MSRKSSALATKFFTHVVAYTIMAYGSTPYVGMSPKKNGSHIKSAQMARSKCQRQISQRPTWAISGIIECFHGQQDR